jgi:KipI family sensor histidine kinase inhibitor
VSNTDAMRTRRVGEHGLLVECTDTGDVAATYRALLAHADDLGAVEIVPAARTVLLDGLDDVTATERLLAGLVPRPAAGVSEGHEVEIPVAYDGPDLAEVAREWSVDIDEVVRIHCGAVFVVAFCGFAPGFAYCTGLPNGLTVSRRPEPRARVAAGSVALAGEFTSVYPTASPGGWQLIGTTQVPVWRPDEHQPALLSPGTRVRFRDASSTTPGFADA